MKLNVKTEALVFDIVHKEGEATRQEILDKLKEQETEISEQELLRYLFRYKARKQMTIRSRKQDDKMVEVWATDRAIFPWYMDGIHAILEKPTEANLKMEFKALNERWKTESVAPVRKRKQWGDYKTFKLTFETVDVILGGRPTEEERETKFPRRAGKLIIPPNWIYGWIRDNQALVEAVALQYHIAVSSGEFVEPPETTKFTLKVKMGLNTYEAILPGAKFEVVLRFPFRGSVIRNEKQLKDFFDLLGVAPIRGFGANSKAFGGRVKLLSMEET